MTSGLMDTVKVDFSSETMEARKQQNDPFKVLKLKTKTKFYSAKFNQKPCIHKSDPSEMKVN